MSKFLKKIGRIIYAIIDSFCKFIDKIIIMPISRLVYNISKSLGGNNISFNKLLNHPRFLIIISLVFAIICFLLIDNKVISLISNEAEIIKNVPVKLVYNDEAFVVENVPETVNITIAGGKSSIYLAKQLGEFEVELNLSKYKEAGTYRAYFTYSKNIDSVDYILDPSYINVEIEDRVSEIKTVDYDLVNLDKLDNKLSVKDVSIDTTEVVVKGSQKNIDKIATVKALISLTYTDEEIKEHKELKDKKKYTEAGTYNLKDIPLVAYDNNGDKINNVTIVSNNMTGTLVLTDNHITVPISVLTTGTLVNGKAIADITINDKSEFSIDIYGEEDDIKDIKSVPVYINVDGRGNESVKTYTVVISKPAGVRELSDKNATIKVTFGDEEQKTVDITSIDGLNVPDGYDAKIANKTISVQVKGVRSNIDKITAANIKPYVDLSGLGEGTTDVEIKINNDNPLVNYVFTSTATVTITKK